MGARLREKSKGENVKEKRKRKKKKRKSRKEGRKRETLAYDESTPKDQESTKQA